MSPDELQRYFESLPEKLEAELTSVLQEQARRLSDAQRAELQSQLQAPAESGDLEASLRVETRDGPLDVHVVAGGDLTMTEVREGSGEDWDRALGFEFGTSHQPARPFFWNTYRALKPSMDQEINHTVERVLKNGR